MHGLSSCIRVRIGLEKTKHSPSASWAEVSSVREEQGCVSCRPYDRRGRHQSRAWLKRSSRFYVRAMEDSLSCEGPKVVRRRRQSTVERRSTCHCSCSSLRAALANYDIFCYFFSHSNQSPILSNPSGPLARPPPVWARVDHHVRTNPRPFPLQETARIDSHLPSGPRGCQCAPKLK
jgi:hypothetical protein